MEFRLFIPDSPRRAWQALRYFIKARRNPVRCYGIDDVRAEHRKTLRALARADDLDRKCRELRTELTAAQNDLSTKENKWRPIASCDPFPGIIYDVWVSSRRSGAQMRVTNMIWSADTREWSSLEAIQWLSPMPPNYRVTHFMRPPDGPAPIEAEEATRERIGKTDAV